MLFRQNIETRFFLCYPDIYDGSLGLSLLQGHVLCRMSLQQRQILKNLNSRKGAIDQMADIERSSEALWQGDLRTGKGQITTHSGVLKDDAYSFATRFENASGTNPEELIAAAQAGCFAMAFASALSKNGYKPESVHTHTTILMDKQDAGFGVTGMRVEVEGRV